MSFKRITALLIALLTVCTLLLGGCSEKVDESSLNETSVGVRGEYIDENGKYYAQTSGNRYDGKTITFITAGELAVYESEILPNTL